MPIDVEETHSRLRAMGACRDPLDRVCACASSSQVWNEAPVADIVWLLTRQPYRVALGEDKLRVAVRAVADAMRPFWRTWARGMLSSGWHHADANVLDLTDRGLVNEAISASMRAIDAARGAEHPSRFQAVNAMKAIRAAALAVNEPRRAMAVVVGAATRAQTAVDIADVIRGVITYEDIEAALVAA